MNVFAALLVLASSAEREQVIPSVTVKGNIATRVVFKGAAGDKVAASCLTLLMSCRYSHAPAEGPMPEWEDTYIKAFNTASHLHVRFAKPQTVKCADGTAVEVTEMLVLLPLNKGRLFVRVGDKAQAFAKYEHEKCVALQRLLKLAEPDE